MNTTDLDRIDIAFGTLAATVNPLAIPVHVPAATTPVPIGRVRAVLHDRTTSPQRRDRIWRHIVTQTRGGDRDWTVAAMGLALPGLRCAAARVARIWPHDDPGDTDAEVIAGFVSALADIDIVRPRVCSRLIQAAFSAGRACARRNIRATQTRQRACESTMPPPISGHVDLVLARAVREKIITRTQAAIIGATRIENRPLTQEATEQGINPAELQHTRDAAEAALRCWITEQTT